MSSNGITVIAAAIDDDLHINQFTKFYNICITFLLLLSIVCIESNKLNCIVAFDIEIQVYMADL